MQMVQKWKQRKEKVSRMSTAKAKKLMGRGNEMQKCCSNPVELYEIAS
jgi:hypothetical protein